MKTNITLLFLLVALQLCAQSDTLINQTDENGKKQGQWIYTVENCEMLNGAMAEIHADYLNDTIHGEYKVYDVQGNLRVNYQVNKGSRVGVGYEYYLSGKIFRIYYLLADKEAYTLEFNSKGYLFNEYTQREDKVIGSYKTYKKGKLYIVKNHNEDGQLDGPFIYYYKNGQEEHVLLFENGIPVSQKRYARSGRLKYDSGAPKNDKDW